MYVDLCIILAFIICFRFFIATLWRIAGARMFFIWIIITWTAFTSFRWTKISTIIALTKRCLFFCFRFYFLSFLLHKESKTEICISFYFSWNINHKQYHKLDRDKLFIKYDFVLIWYYSFSLIFCSLMRI